MTLTLETARLILRPVSPDDVEPHAAMLADPGFAEFMSPDKKPLSREAAWRIFAILIGHWEIRGFGFFSVFEKASGRWMGRVGPWMPEGWPGLECGWSIAPGYWGRGYAGEAAVAAINWIFDEKPDLSRIISLIAPANAKSQAVAHKIGEEKTAEIFMFDPTTPLDIWAADRDQWQATFG